MSHRLAFLVATVLTAFVVATTSALVLHVGDRGEAQAQPDQADARDESAPASPDGSTLSAAIQDAVLQREAVYRQRIDEANAQLQQSQELVAALRADLERLRAQNAALLERDATYRERLEEANRLLQQPAEPPRPEPDVPSAPSLAAWSPPVAAAPPVQPAAALRPRPTAPPVPVTEEAPQPEPTPWRVPVALLPTPLLPAPTSQPDPALVTQASAPPPTPTAAPARPRGGREREREREEHEDERHEKREKR